MSFISLGTTVIPTLKYKNLFCQTAIKTCKYITVDYLHLPFSISLSLFLSLWSLFKQALWVCSDSGGGKRKESCNYRCTSLEFEYLHQKSWFKMLIGGDDIKNGVTTLGACFYMFFNVCTCFHFVLIGGNLTAQSTGSHRGIGRRIQIPEMYLQAHLSFSCPTARVPQRAWLQANQSMSAFTS